MKPHGQRNDIAPRKPRKLGRLLLAMMILGLIPGCIIPFGKSDDANRAFVLSYGFVEIAAQRLYVEAGLQIPRAMAGIAPEDKLAQERYGHFPPCFIRGAPNATVGQEGACLTQFYWANSDRKMECSLFKREICNAVNVPINVLENPRFITIIEEYAANMCQFLRDHREISAPAAARYGHLSRNFSRAQTLERSLICVEGADRPIVKEEAKEFWRRMRPLILVRSRDGTIAEEIELRLQFANLQPR